MDETTKPRSDAHWRERLSRDEYLVARCGATERAFSGKYWDHRATGVYACLCCGTPLFSSGDKFDSRTGWPSFTRELAAGSVRTQRDFNLGMIRTEARCAACDAHLGHVFEDGPEPTRMRYCINSASLRFDTAAVDSEAAPKADNAPE